LNAASFDRSRPPEAGPIRPFQFPDIERFELSNGMPVYYSRTGPLPVVTFSVILPAGATREEASQAGLATLTGDLLESGTHTLDAAEIARELEMLGVRLHVGTSWEATTVDISALSGKVTQAVDVAAQLVRDSVFPEDEVERLRHEQLAGIMQRRADPRSFANEMANRYIFAPESAFSRPVSGTAGTVGGLTRQDVIGFHRAAFTPVGTGIVVAGNIDLAEIREIAERALGGWRGDPPPTQPIVVKPRAEEIRVVVVDRPGSVQSEIRVGHVGVPRNTPDFFPILVMNTILGGAFSSRLNLNLRERHGFTYGAHSTFSMRRHAGPFVVSAAVATEVTGPAVREIFNELRAIREERVRPDELTDARNYAAGTFPLRLQTTDGVASRLAELFVYDLPTSYLEEFADRVLAVSEEEVLDVAQRTIQPDRATVLVVGDAAKVRPQLEDLRLGPVEVVARQVDE
jgi:zinc protease